MAKAVGSVKSSVKSVGHAVTSVPGTLYHTVVENVADGLAKALTVSNGKQTDEIITFMQRKIIV